MDEGSLPSYDRTRLLQALNVLAQSKRMNHA